LQRVKAVMDSPAGPPYFRGMPPRRRTSKDTPAKLAARMRSWRVSLLRGRAQPLGTVEAPDARAAEAAAVEQFQLSYEQRKRLAVRENDGGGWSGRCCVWS
jgi:hypothetical protein